jgi:hypothetical protein
MAGHRRVLEARRFKIHAGEGVKVRKLNFPTWFLLGVLLAMLVPGPARSEDEKGYEVAKPDISLPKLQARLSADGLVLNNAVPPLVLVADPNPQMQGQRTLGRTADDALAAPDAAVSTFSITYLAAGQQDPWQTVCGTFPENAKAAFQAAAAIWQNKVRSSVPITIRACWANLGSSSVLGYSGGQPIVRNFSGAPKANVWYQQSLANALTGVKQTSNFDMHITYNSGFAWYFGTDGNTPYGKYDLVTVAAHEIAHGLNFSGTAQYSGGVGSYGYSGSPSIYDTFMQSATGTPLTSYANSSSALGTLLTSGSLWFNGSNANAANGGSRVRIYAPSSWSGGSSFSHLDYASYASTANRMMVYAISSASAMHDPGPVTLGLMKDLGWPTDAGFSMSGTVRAGSATGTPLAGATVTIAGKSSITSSTGSFSITGIPAGSYTLAISKTGFVTKTVAGYAVSGNQSGLNFFLAPAYSMSGTVRQGSGTGPALAGATVTIAGKSAITSSLGTFGITGLAAGSHTLTISKAGFVTKTTTGYLIAGNQSGLNWFLLPVPVYSMSGIVRSGSATGPPLAGATLAIAGRNALSTSTGSFTITAIPAGTHSLTISRTGYYTKVMAGIVVSANRSGVVLYLTPVPTYSMSGTVRRGTGPALPGATLTIAGKTVLSSSTGTFSITGIPAGTQTLVISKPGYVTKSSTGSIGANQSGLVFYLVPCYTMSGTVRSGSATGAVLAGASVSIAGKTAVTGSYGTFSIAAIPVGSYTLTISKSGYLTRTVTGYAVNGNQSGLNFYLSLTPSYTMSGTVRSGSATGPALAGATVSIAAKTALTSSTGTFAISGIAPGSYTLTISKSGFTTRTIAGYPVNANQGSLVFYLAPAPSYGTIKVVNGSGTFGIAQLYISPSWSPEWGPNQISSALPPGYVLNVTQVPPDDYDLLAVFSNGSSYTAWQLPVVAGMTTTIAAAPGASGAVQLLKSSEAGQGGGTQIPLRPEGGGRPKR